MRVADYIVPIKPITEQSLRKECMEVMMDNLCYELPVLKDNKLFGTVQLDECIHSQDEMIEQLVESGFASVGGNSHLFDVLHIFNESKANVCCVLNDQFAWVGIITKTIVLEALAQSLTIGQTGAVLIIEMASHQYSSSEIARVIEGEGAQLLGLWLNNMEDSGRIRVSLKLNVQNAERITNSLQRYGYETVATFGDDDFQENVEKRFQSLMKYIDI